MLKVLVGIIGTLAVAAAGASIVLYAGLIDMAADSPHGPTMYRVIEFARERSIARLAGTVKPPGDLADPARLRRGAGNYAAMCAGCHLSPGVTDSEIRRGLYPQPPDLVRIAATPSDRERIAARRFWIIKHGIKASGMPAWSRGGMEDAAIWDMTAFLDRLPTLSAEQYRDFVEASQGHSHAGMAEGSAGADAAHHDAPALEQPREHEHGNPPHKHAP